MIDRLFTWIFDKIYIKTITLDVWGKFGWKWYGGFGVMQKDKVYYLEVEND